MTHLYEHASSMQMQEFKVAACKGSILHEKEKVWDSCFSLQTLMFLWLKKFNFKIKFVQTGVLYSYTI